MKKMLCIILACAVCLLPVSFAQAKEVTASPCRLSGCKEGIHGTVHLVEKKEKYGGSDSTTHWTKCQQVATCDSCGAELEVVKEWKEDIEGHALNAIGWCGKCYYNYK